VKQRGRSGTEACGIALSYKVGLTSHPSVRPLEVGYFYVLDRFGEFEAVRVAIISLKTTSCSARALYRGPGQCTCQGLGFCWRTKRGLKMATLLFFEEAFKMAGALRFAKLYALVRPCGWRGSGVQI
jgi:hypothetical protein